MASDTTIVPLEAVFSLDLGINGGFFAPSSASECQTWIETERNFWSWLTSVSGGNHRNALDQAINPLHQAASEVQFAFQHQHSPGTVRERLINAGNLIEDCFNRRKWPHSTTRLAKRVEEIRKRDPLEAQC